MATLSSSSTWSEILAEYDDTAGYEEHGSVALAKGFVTAGGRDRLSIGGRQAREGSGDAARRLTTPFPSATFDVMA
ncbi:MAG: hypothetical protein JXB62_16110 [Pirellulales bacterium]|nr:hypothetical protein [Pirellulales bacterium]